MDTSRIISIQSSNHFHSILFFQNTTYELKPLAFDWLLMNLICNLRLVQGNCISNEHERFGPHQHYYAGLYDQAVDKEKYL